MRRILWLLTLICLPFAAMAQESDKNFLTRYLEENLSSAGRNVIITGFAGALSSRATMAQMTIADDTGVWLTVKDVTLDWSRSALLRGQIVVNEFSAGEIDIARLPHIDPATPKAEARGFIVPDLPVSIDIKTIAARRIILGPTVLGQAVEGSLTASAQLAGGEGNAVLNLTRTDSGPAGVFNLLAGYVKETGALTLDLTAKEGAGGVAVRLLGVPGAPAAELSVKGGGPISSFVADVALRTDDVTRLGGKVTLFQDNGNTGFEADLAGDPTPIFLPQYATFFGPDVALRVKGQRYADGRTELSALHVSAQALELNGLLNLDAEGVPSSFSLTGHMGLPEGSVVLPLTTERETRLFAADLTLNYSRLAGDIWQGKATVEGLDHAAFKASAAELSGSGHITNGAAGAAFDGRIDFVTKGLAATDPALAKALGDALNGQVVLNWQTGQDVKISNLSLAGDGYAVATAGSIGGFADGFALTGTAQGNYDDLSRLADLTGRPLQGGVGFDLEGTASPLTGMVDLAGTLRGKELVVGMRQVDGLLTGETTIAVSVKRDEAGTTIRQLNLTATGLNAQVQGLITTEAVDLTGNFNLADARVLGAGYGGAVRGKATVSGPLATALVNLDADATNLAIGQSQLDGLLAGDSNVKLTLRLNADGAAIEQADLTFADGRLTAKGQVGTLSNDLTANLTLANLAALNFGLSGGFDGDVRFTGTSTNGKLLVTAQAQGLALGQTLADTLLRGSSQLIAELDLTPQGIGVTQLELNNGQIKLSASGTVNGSERRLELDSRIVDLALLYPQFPGAVVAKGTATQNASGYTLDLGINGPAQIDARVNGTMSNNMRTADLAISGTAAAGLANKIVAPRAVSGLVRYDLRLRGPVALNAISGTVNLTNGEVADPSQNFGLRGVTVTAQLANGQ
ncbi:MAG: translocation and assembly module protein TamB, partial [Candidatus Saccharibacteria bacterium]|nr:translocation and assembly module protein TamB [Pseudorhodobacter sp.]